MTRPETAASWPTTALATSRRTASSASRARSEDLAASVGDATSVICGVPLSPVRQAMVASSSMLASSGTVAGPSRRSTSSYRRPLTDAAAAATAAHVGARLAARGTTRAAGWSPPAAPRRRGCGRGPCGRAGRGSRWSRRPAPRPAAARPRAGRAGGRARGRGRARPTRGATARAAAHAGASGAGRVVSSAATSSTVGTYQTRWSDWPSSRSATAALSASVTVPLVRKSLAPTTVTGGAVAGGRQVHPVAAAGVAEARRRAGGCAASG